MNDKKIVKDAIGDIEKKFDVEVWAEWVDNKESEPKKVNRNYWGNSNGWKIYCWRWQGNSC